MRKKRLAIIGAGSSGLITLKNAIDRLPGWEITCFEKGDETTGCWGNPYPGFVSTSTKYTTQFSCYRKWDSTSPPKGRASKSDFFRDGEYGEYLTDFCNHFQLAPHIRLNTPVHHIRKAENGWSLDFGGITPHTETFDSLILCTGLVAKPKPIESAVPTLGISDLPVSGKTIVVIGGGESGADHAHRLARPELGNRVYLSLKNGIRVSPRYHPIRGVPSDFLRNRLLLSIDPTIRNVIGQKFVEARIRHRERFEKFFGTTTDAVDQDNETTRLRKYWDEKLTARAKDNLFNVFHTKSDGFLDDVAESRITIIGAPLDGTYQTFHDFDGKDAVTADPDFILPAIGFTSGLSSISNGEIHISDFFHGCIHKDHPDLFLVGFARPIIGNIPTISEMQARHVIGTIAGKFERSTNITATHAADRKRIKTNFPRLNTENIYPVEMFPYCDRLSRMSGTFPSLKKVGSLPRWLKIQLSPASTTHYLNEDFSPEETDRSKIHSPPLITALLAVISIFTLPYLLLSRCRKNTP